MKLSTFAGACIGAGVVGLGYIGPSPWAVLIVLGVILLLVDFGNQKGAFSGNL